MEKPSYPERDISRLQMINPNVILDFSNLSPLMSNRIESLSSRIQQARELTVGVRLTAADVTLLTCLCRSSPLPPNPPGDDERIFKNVKFNAEMAQIDGSVGKGSGIFFPRRESAVIDNFLERSLRYREYRRGTKSANMVLPHFMTLYQYYDDDDYHCLDYKMDRSIDYTSHVEIDGGFTELHKCGPSEVEYVAQLYFFAIVAVFEKLEKSQAPSKGTNLKQKEAMALLTWFRQNPPSFYPERHEESVESVASAFSKIHNALASHDPCAEAILTTPEVEHLLAISERVPRPKSVSESGARPNLPSQAPGRVSVGKDANGATAKQQGEDSVPAQTVEVFQTCADILFKFRKQRAAGSGMSIHCTHAQGIWAFCTMHLVRYPELIISPSRNPEHPQVTALAKLDAARRDRYMVAPVHFVLEEVQVLTDVMELPPRELPPSKNQCLFSASNTNSISKGLESTIETILEEKRAGKSGEPVKKPAEPAKQSTAEVESVIEKMVQTFAEEALSFIPNCTAKSAKLPNSAGDQLSVVTNATKELSISFKQLSQEKDDVIKKSEQLLKKLTAKDRDLAKKDREIGYAGQISHKRQEELKSEASKTQTELEVAKRELEKAHKEPDRVRDEFSAKIQKLHDKVRGLEEYLQVKDSNISVLELDNEAMTKDLEASKAKVGRRDERLKKFTDEYKKLKDERDLLRLNLQTQSQVSERLRRDQANRITTEQALEQAAKLEKDLEKLNKDRLTDGNAISALQKELAEEREKSKRLGTKLASIIELIAKD